MIDLAHLAATIRQAVVSAVDRSLSSDRPAATGYVVNEDTGPASSQVLVPKGNLRGGAEGVRLWFQEAPGPTVFAAWLHVLRAHLHELEQLRVLAASGEEGATEAAVFLAQCETYTRNWVATLPDVEASDLGEQLADLGWKVDFNDMKGDQTQ